MTAGAKGVDTGGAMYLGYNSGTYDAITHVQIKKIGDVQLPLERAASDKDTRETPNTKTTLGNLKYSPITFPYYKRVGTDTVWNKLRDSLLNGTVIDLFALDADPTDLAYGFRGPYRVSKMGKGEPVNDAVQYDVELVEVDHEEDGVAICTEEWTND
jgi:hypothetical protein